MNTFCWKILLFALTTGLSIEMCCAQWGSYKYQFNKDLDIDKDDKPKPYEFNDAELTAIQALVAFREVIGELLQKVGFSWPSLNTLLSNSDSQNNKASISLASEDSLTSAKRTAGLASAVLRGVALSLPLLIPMATTIRRMAPDQYLPPLPFIPDPYYNSAMHRRRGRSLQSTGRYAEDKRQLLRLENILTQIDSLSRKYGKAN